MALLVTFTLTVQEAPAARAPPVSETVVAPAAPVALPPQVLLSELSATTRPDGKLSVNAIPENDELVVLLSVMVNKLTPLG